MSDNFSDSFMTIERTKAGQLATPRPILIRRPSASDLPAALVAKRAGVTLPTLYRWVERDEFPPFHVIKARRFFKAWDTDQAIAGIVRERARRADDARSAAIETEATSDDVSGCFMTIAPTKSGPWRVVNLIHFSAVAGRLGVSEAHLRRMVRRGEFPAPEVWEGRLVCHLKGAEKAIRVIERQRRAAQRPRARRRPAAAFPRQHAATARERHSTRQAKEPAAAPMRTSSHDLGAE